MRVTNNAFAAERLIPLSCQLSTVSSMKVVGQLVGSAG